MHWIGWLGEGRAWISCIAQKAGPPRISQEISLTLVCVCGGCLAFRPWRTATAHWAAWLSLRGPGPATREKLKPCPWLHSPQAPLLQPERREPSNQAGSLALRTRLPGLLQHVAGPVLQAPPTRAPCCPPPRKGAGTEHTVASRRSPAILSEGRPD